jgi:hypothetical protein
MNSEGAWLTTIAGAKSHLKVFFRGETQVAFEQYSKQHGWLISTL